MRFDTLITNGKLVTETGIYDHMVVGINGGRISFVGSDDHTFEGVKSIDVQNNYILPGIIDIHKGRGRP